MLQWMPVKRPARKTGSIARKPEQTDLFVIGRLTECHCKISPFLILVDALTKADAFGRIHFSICEIVVFMSWNLICPSKNEKSSSISLGPRQVDSDSSRRGIFYRGPRRIPIPEEKSNFFPIGCPKFFCSFMAPLLLFPTEGLLCKIFGFIRVYSL